MAGLAGNDRYIVDNAGDKVVEAAGGGGDRVLASVSFALAAGQAVETIGAQDEAGTSALNLNGNELAQTLRGNAGANVLNGLGGADIMVGLAGRDSFAFSTTLGAGNVDVISDFVAVDDTIRLYKSVFAALQLGQLGADFFKEISAGVQDGNDRVLYNKATGALFYDADGSGGNAAQQFATLANKPADLSAADFLVV